MEPPFGRARILIAEAIGTLILMLAGPGVAIVGIAGLGGGPLSVALGFGIGLLIAAYAVGHVSGAHVNPAVTMAMWLTRKLDARAVPTYLVGQVCGALIGALVIWVVAKGTPGFDAQPATFAANLWGAEHGFKAFGAMLIAEVVLTGVLVLMVLATTRAGYPAGVGGLHLGATLAVIHMISIPIDNTSVNPARSIGTAIFAGGAAIEQVWAFVVFPLVGAAFGALLWQLIEPTSTEPTPIELVVGSDPVDPAESAEPS